MFFGGILGAFAVIIWMNYGLDLYEIAIIFEQKHSQILSKKRA